MRDNEERGQGAWNPRNRAAGGSPGRKTRNEQVPVAGMARELTRLNIKSLAVSRSVLSCA